MPIRIDSLVPGDHITLKFATWSREDPNYEPAVFVGITGEGNDRRAEFVSKYHHDSGRTSGDGTYKWQAYRFKPSEKTSAHWAYGTSAQRLSVEEIITPSVLRDVED